MNILYLAYEVEDYLISKISGDLKLKINNSASSVFYCDTWRWTDKSHLKITKELNNNFDNNFDLSYEYQLINAEKSFKVDFEYLRDLEKKIGVTFELIMTSDPLLYRPTHDRNYYSDIGQSLRMFWLELVLKKIEKCLNESRPNLVFTIGNNYLVKNLFKEMCKLKNIKMLTLGPTRLNNSYMLSENFLLQTPKSFFAGCEAGPIYSNLYNSSLKKITELLDSPYDSHKEYKRKIGFALLKQFIVDLPTIFNQFRSKIKYSNSIFQPNLLDNKYWASIRYELIIIFRAIFLQLYKYDAVDSSKEYAYFPMHVTPESSVLTMGRGSDEYQSIRNISIRLPIGVNLVVKENPKMIGLRPISYYNRLKKIPNVLLVSPNDSQQELIKNSKAVFTVAGTSALEGLFFNKPIYCIGNTEYSGLEGVTKLDSSYKPIAIPVQPSKNGIIDYCNFIEKSSIKIDMNYLLYAPYQSDEVNENSYMSDLNKIVELLALSINND